MKWSIKIGRWFGIDVYLHVTFVLVLVFVALTHWLATRNVPAALEGVLFFVALFACVLLHEFGHALVAQRYGITTRDITLLPIGGLARLERIPDNPRQELLIAVAGPAVNVVIAVMLGLVLAVTTGFQPVGTLGVADGSFVQRLLVVNLLLVGFNLLPAFPMDGGRVLRAVLALRMEYARATQIAATVGQGMALLFGLVGLLGMPILLLIALFVWIGAGQEASMVQMRSSLAGVPVAETMLTRFQTLEPQDPLSHVVKLILAGSQQDFPVLENGRVIGVLERRAFVDALAREGPTATVGTAMKRSFPEVSPAEPVAQALARQREAGLPMVPVTENGRLVGLLTLDNLTEFLLIKSALSERKPPVLARSAAAAPR